MRSGGMKSLSSLVLGKSQPQYPIPNRRNINPTRPFPIGRVMSSEIVLKPRQTDPSLFCSCPWILWSCVGASLHQFRFVSGVIFRGFPPVDPVSSSLFLLDEKFESFAKEDISFSRDNFFFSRHSTTRYTVPGGNNSHTSCKHRCRLYLLDVVDSIEIRVSRVARISSGEWFCYDPYGSAVDEHVRASRHGAQDHVKYLCTVRIGLAVGLAAGLCYPRKSCH